MDVYHWVTTVATSLCSSPISVTTVAGHQFVATHDSSRPSVCSDPIAVSAFRDNLAWVVMCNFDVGAFAHSYIQHVYLTMFAIPTQSMHPYGIPMALLPAFHGWWSVAPLQGRCADLLVERLQQLHVVVHLECEPREPGHGLAQDCGQSGGQNFTCVS